MDALSRNQFQTRVFSTFGYVVLLTIAAVMYPSNPAQRHYDWADASSIVRLCLEVLVILGFSYKAYREIREFIKGVPGFNLWLGLKEYYGSSGYGLIENISSTLFILLMVGTIISRALESSAYGPFVCFTLLITWCYTLTLLLGFKMTGPLVIMMIQIYTRDVFRFVLIYSLVLCGFAGAFYVLEETDSMAGNGFEVFIGRTRTLFFVLLNSFDQESFHDGIAPQYKSLSFILLVLYIVTLTIMLLNLLIAMMGDTFNSTKDDADKIWHMSYAQIIVSLESEMSEADLRNESVRYWMEDEGRKYLQMEEVNAEHYLPEKKEGGSSTLSAVDILKEADVNKDGMITPEELAAYLVKAAEEESKQEALEKEREYSRPVAHNLIGPDGAGGGPFGNTSVIQKRK